MVKKVHGDTFGIDMPDMVVIEFDKPFNLISGIIEPACLPTQKIEKGTKCFTSGWGSLNDTTKEFPTNLQAVGVEVSDIQGFMKEITENP